MCLASPLDMGRLPGPGALLGGCTLEPLEGAYRVFESIALPLGKTVFKP